MKIYFRDQSLSFPSLLQMLAGKEVTTCNMTRLNKKYDEVRFTSEKTFETLVKETLLSYKIFPDAVMRSFTAWEVEKRPMTKGDTILQQVHLPPLMGFSIKLIVGVRITDIQFGNNFYSFTYQTLSGHPEEGTSTFSIKKNESDYTFSIKTYSRPGSILTLPGISRIALLYQNYCTKKALEHVRSIAIN